MKGKHATQKGGLNSASQKLETLVEMSISSNNNFVWTNMSWSPKTCSKFFKIQNSKVKVIQILLELWLGTLFIFSWVFTCINFFLFHTWKEKRCKTECRFDQTYKQSTLWLIQLTLLIYWLADWLTWHADRLTDLLTYWLTDWLFDWLAETVMSRLVDCCWPMLLNLQANVLTTWVLPVVTFFLTNWWCGWLIDDQFRLSVRIMTEWIQGQPGWIVNLADWVSH